MNNKIKISIVLPQDITELQSFSFRTFYEGFAHLNTASDIKIYMDKAFSREQLDTELNNPESFFYFAKLNDQVIGYVKINIGQSQTDLKGLGGLEIERIYVDKDLQGRQIGKLLLDHVIQIAKDRKAEFVWLGVWERNVNAIRFYELHGFVQTGSHPFLLGEDLQTDLIMKLEIK